MTGDPNVHGPNSPPSSLATPGLFSGIFSSERNRSERSLSKTRDRNNALACVKTNANSTYRSPGHLHYGRKRNPNLQQRKPRSGCIALTTHSRNSISTKTSPSQKRTRSPCLRLRIRHRPELSGRVGSLGAILLLIIMATQYRSFNTSGPLYLTAVDWRNPHHRRSAAASLVQGVYSQEHDRQQNLQGHQALAPPWWDFFNFRLFRVLVDNDDGSIFGAIYEFKSPPPYGQHNPLHIPPRYVVAFRGTMTGWETMKQDLMLDLRVIRNTLEQTTRFQHAMQAVQEAVSIAGATNICLAGHSLGSAMALLAGKNMAKMGYFLETYLFNPPFISLPIDMMTKTKILKSAVRIMHSVTTVGVTIALNALRQRPQTGDWFAALSGWTPYLFVNLSDPISAEYVGYFEHRERMAAIGAGAIERVSARNSISGAIEPLHLLPSAYLTINGSLVQGLGQAHGLDQWWNPNIQCRSKLHQPIGNR
ncbi:hypothetical protein RHMOL_Rhmol02G0131500 [Rhododendron molle]|uniref:Uncharacterized protein n=1 Tax=Rhododendron molle TaxID=49168 RepID=A0ACC0PPA9_RHOML|nr:hypothetical protein RHMOL_Rhmol02G0131500 [Rhododendron molle]